MKKTKTFAIAILITFVTVIAMYGIEQLISMPSSMNHDMSSMDHEEIEGIKHGHIGSVGPGEAPHLHNIDYSKFDSVKDISRMANDVPKATNRNNPELVIINLEAKEVISDIAPDIKNHYWTFNGTVPGPMLRVREGDTVQLTLSNHKSSSHNHSIDLHAVTGPGGGAAFTEVEPGQSKTIQFKVLNPGLFVYHCAIPNVPMHMAHGMYGMILVEPKAGMTKVDKEFYVMQGELYTQGGVAEKGFQEFSAEKMHSEQPTYVLFNGRVKSLVDNPLKAKVGERVRLYVGNGGVSYISSFHMIGEIFDLVHPEAALEKLHNVQTTLIPAGGATIVEFDLEVPGNYVLVDHALARVDKGAWGILEVTGKENPEIYSAIE